MRFFAVLALVLGVGGASAASQHSLPEVDRSTMPRGIVIPTRTEQIPYKSEQARALVVAPPKPRVMPTIVGTALYLSRGMGRAMFEALPGFEWWSPSHYSSSVIRQYAFSPVSAPFAVLGDFNKDGIVDAALHGYYRKQELILVLLSAKKSFRVIEIKQDSSSGSPEWDLALKFLTRVPPGKLVSRLEKEPLVIDRDAFQVNQLGKDSTVYYFSKGKFLPYQMDGQPAP